MKFGNVVAYCKGFYKRREGDVPMIWKDMAHCIMCDGWTISNRKDVAQWCMRCLEDFAKEFPEEAWKVSFGTFYSKIEHNKEIVKIAKRYNELSRKLDDLDYIIWTFRDFIRYGIDGDKFTEGIIPDESVLPLSEHISKNLWNKINKTFDKQDTTKWYYGTYESRENIINSN